MDLCVMLKLNHMSELIEDELLAYIDDGYCTILQSRDNYKEFGFVNFSAQQSAIDRLKVRSVPNWFISESNRCYKLIWINQSIIDEFNLIVDNLKCIKCSAYINNSQSNEHIYYNSDSDWIFYFDLTMTRKIASHIICSYDNYWNIFKFFQSRKIQKNLLNNPRLVELSSGI